jgi:RNA polymerase sigma-70 factor, ECF subfamily
VRDTPGAARGMLHPMSEDDALLLRARAGDRRAFDRIVEVHLRQVWKVVWRIVRHREDTEDVVQEVFLTAYRSMAEFRGEAQLGTWLHKIAVTRALNHLDRAGERLRRSSEPLQIDVGDGPQEPAAEVERRATGAFLSPLQALEEKELKRRLASCLQKLPGAFRAVLALRDAESLSYERIAEVLGIQLGTVRSRLARARLQLRDCVEGRTP